MAEEDGYEAKTKEILNSIAKEPRNMDVRKAAVESVLGLCQQAWDTASVAAKHEAYLQGVRDGTREAYLAGLRDSIEMDEVVEAPAAPKRRGRAKKSE